jgi:hypothetical protein
MILPGKLSLSLSLYPIHEDAELNEERVVKKNVIIAIIINIAFNQCPLRSHLIGNYVRKQLEIHTLNSNTVLCPCTDTDTNCNRPKLLLFIGFIIKNLLQADY